MDPDGTRREIADTGVLRPSFALVQHGVLIGLFGPDEAETATSAAYRMTETEGHHVDVYEIDSRLPPPPQVGAAVDPDALGWIDVDR
jgi:hypothetical protein